MVMWLVDELAIPHEQVEAGGLVGGLDTPEFREMNPHGKVPIIKDDGVVVWESHAIMRYLAAQYGKDIFWSDDPAQRSRVDRWMDWSQTALQPEFVYGVYWCFFGYRRRSMTCPPSSAA
jgi:glutathione S-transferase